MESSFTVLNVAFEQKRGREIISRPLLLYCLFCTVYSVSQDSLRLIGFDFALI